MLWVFRVRCSRNWCHSTFSEARFAIFWSVPADTSEGIFRETGKRGCFAAGFEAKFDNFFCQEPRSRSPGVAAFVPDWGGVATSESGAGKVSAGDFVRGWSGTFFFEALLQAMAALQRGLSEQYLSISAVQVQTETDIQTGTSALSGSSKENQPSA